MAAKTKARDVIAEMNADTAKREATHAAADALGDVPSDVLFAMVAKRWAADDRPFIEALIRLHNAHRERSSITSRGLRKLISAREAVEAV